MIQNQTADSIFRVIQNRLDVALKARLNLIPVLLLLATALNGQVANVQTATTATQAVISYTAPGAAVCTIAIMEGNATAPLVHDVDPSLFPGSNLDSRSGSVVTGRKRVFVAGKRTAEPALDGKRYSRALQTNTGHVFKIACGSDVYNGQFSTMNAPLGATYNDPLPVDPNQPGQYAWPSFGWNNRNEWLVDPKTGFLLKQLDSPRDTYEQQGNGLFVNATGAVWNNPSGLLADDTSVASYSGTTQDWLFVDLGLEFLNSAAHGSGASSANTFVPSFNAWCSSSDCGSAGNADRTIQFCLTANGTTCASDMLEATLAACSSNCTSSQYRFAGITNAAPILGGWFASGNPTIDVTSLSKRTGNVSRNGASVTWINGDRFSQDWGANSSITIGGVLYTIASIDSDQSMTLNGSPAGSDGFISYTASNAGLLIRKKTTTTHQISIQYLSYVYELGDAPSWEAAGDEDTVSNCAATLVSGPQGELGWHCHFGGVLYWIGQSSGTVNRIGRPVPPYNPATPNGWYQLPCQGGAFWDWTDANSLYCTVNTVGGSTVLLKFKYTGDNRDIGNMTVTQAVVACGTAPCWTVQNLTPVEQGLSLDAQMANFNSQLWRDSHFHTNFIQPFGRMGKTNALLFLVRRDQNNDSLAFLFKYDLNANRITGALPTWHYWPARWAGSHGPNDLVDPNYVFVAMSNFRGPFSGSDNVAGNGPYYSSVASGPLPGTGSPCPSYPAGSIIAQADWPVGNFCTVITVDGEPGDPTPKQYSSGTVSVSGANVTGSNVYWTSFMDGSQMLINGVYYNFTFVDYFHGTLAPAPTSPITGASYTLFLEPVNNPKVGPQNFAYLQDAEVRDIFCLVNKGQEYCTAQYPSNGNEFARLIAKDPTTNTWTLERGYAGGNGHSALVALNANAWLIAMPGSCYFTSGFPCGEARLLWQANLDPLGQNASGTTLVKDLGDHGCCHSARQNGINLNIAGVCPSRDGNSSGCYNARFAGLPEAFTTPEHIVSSNPLFHGLAGVGYPNSVEVHPSHSQALTTGQEKIWANDGRPFLGDDVGNLTGTASSPGIIVAGSLYKFTAAQTSRLRARHLPTLASCGVNPLLNISGPAGDPANLITGATTDNYKYCIALNSGECFSGSAPGDVYVNCPRIQKPYCSYGGVGNADTELRDICIADMGAYTMNATQFAVNKADPDGVNGRRVTEALGRYHWLFPFWNVKTVPDGKFMITPATFVQGQRNILMLVKLPPFPSADSLNRGDYIPVGVTIPQPTTAGVDNAVVQFGYDKNYFCNARRETCVKGSAVDYMFKSENPAGVACSNGCTINVPAISQRILYYQVLLRDGQNNVVSTMSPEVRSIP